MGTIKLLFLLFLFVLELCAGIEIREKLTGQKNEVYTKDSEPIFDYQQQILNQNKEIDTLKDVVKSIENIVLQQSTEIANQKHTIKELQDQLNKLTNQQQETSNSDNNGMPEQEEVVNSNQDQSKQEPSTEALTDGLNKQTNPNQLSPSMNESKTNTIKSRRFLTEDVFAFHSINEKPETSHFHAKQALMFPTVQLNRGNAYHPSHSIFIATTPGIYIFSASVLSYVGDKSECSAAIVKNGNILAKAYGHGDNGRHDQGSVTLVTELANGDEVWVQMIIEDSSIWGGGFTSFTGALLYAV